MSIKNKIKENGVIYTPAWIVKEILDKSNFTHNIFDKKIIEPSCGDGAFLVQIVERIILDAKRHLINVSKIKNFLSKNVFGLDIDDKAIDVCKSRLNAVCEKNNIPLPKWDNIIVADILSKNIIDEYFGKFDFVFGNPPYVRIQNLSKTVREFVNSKLTLCKHGSTDLYIAFFELGYLFLNDKGILGYITPNTFLTSAAGKELRSFILNKVEAFVDFEHHQVFDDATTYSLITILNKKSTNDVINLYKGDKYSIGNACDLFSKRLGPDNWILENEDILNKIDEIKKQGKPLNEIAKIHTGLATLKDELFIFKDPKINGNNATIILKNGKSFEIEKIILKKIIKASTWKNSADDQELFIIFPYVKVKDKYTIISELEMEKDFPLTLKYFKSVKKELLKRDKGDKDKLAKYPEWYAFGRSQGIDTSFGKKIITAAINLKPRFIVCEEENSTYYAGYSVHCEEQNLYKLVEKLNSDDMAFFIKYTSRDYQGEYKSYSKSFIEGFGVDL